MDTEKNILPYQINYPDASIPNMKKKNSLSFDTNIGELNPLVGYILPIYFLINHSTEKKKIAKNKSNFHAIKYC